MKRTTFILLLIFTLSLNAQFETTHWMFGTHAGLNFQTVGGVISQNSHIDTEEGCSSIADMNGNLLFYTDGQTIYDRNHQPMTNGTNLKGDRSSTQSALIVPKPGNSNLFYVFTSDDGYSSPSTNGINYSVVDITLNNGLGDVIPGQKNINLIDKASEKLTGVVSSDGISIWILTLAPRTQSTIIPYLTIGSNFGTFYAFKLNSNGLDNQAIVSQLPIQIDGGVGYIKFSPDGTKIGMANLDDETAYLLDFDDTTGVVSNPVSIFQNLTECYGVEFSPDSSKLYISEKNNKIEQFDLDNGNAMTIINTQQNYRSALQLGPDGKIYQTHTLNYGQGTNKLSVIENPNMAGTACNYNYDAISLYSSQQVHQGLPNFVQSNFLHTLGIDNFTQLNNVKMFPNPAINHINISLPNTNQYNIEIYTLTSQLVLSKSINDTKNVKLNISKLTRQRYLLIVKDLKNKRYKTFYLLKK